MYVDPISLYLINRSELHQNLKRINVVHSLQSYGSSHLSFSSMTKISSAPGRQEPF